MIFDSILNRPPTPPVRLNPDLPPKLEEIINKALEKDRDLRYHSAADLRADLKRMKRDMESGHTWAEPSGTVAVHEAHATQNRKLWRIAAPAAVLLAAALIAAPIQDHAIPRRFQPRRLNRPSPMN